MQKRYDYHSIDEYIPILSTFIVAALAVITIAIIVGQSVLEKTVFFLLGSSVIVGVIRTYLKGKNTYVEISDGGILFNGWKERFFSTWSEVKEIKIMTPIYEAQRYRIYTDRGCFLISMIEPADSPQHLPWDRTKKEAGKYTEELIWEIKKRSPYVKMTYSIWNRPL